MSRIIEEEFVNIAVLENMIEAQLLESILKEEKIPHHIRSFHDTAYDGLFQVQLGWGELRAPLPYKNEIMEILEDIRSGHQADDG